MTALKPDGPGWPIAVREQLAAIWNAGASAAQCADILSPVVGRVLTRNSILGQVKRMRDGGTKMAVKGIGRRGAKPRPTVSPDGWPLPSQCCWPIGDPREAGFRFCCAARKGDGRYCPEHVAVAFRGKDETR